MEGSEGEAVFDAYNLNPQLFINEVLNAIEDIGDGAFDFYLQQASSITAGGDSGDTDRSEALAQGVSFLHNLTQVLLDKRMSIWEKYCLRHCFDVPKGFVLPKAQNSSGPLLHEEFSEEDLDSQLDTLKKKLESVGQESAELEREIHDLEKLSTLSSSCDAPITETLRLYEDSFAHKTFQASEVAAARTESIQEAESPPAKRIRSSSSERREDSEEVPSYLKPD